jgi:hypothetical protein
MWRRRIVVPLALALGGLGWALAHAVAHHAVTGMASPQAVAPQGYLAYAPTSLVLCLALALPLAAGAALGRRGRRASLRFLWLFGLVPVLGFAGHAFAEPLVVGGSPAAQGAAAAALAPVLLVGLLIQVPFALAALGLARGIVLLAEAVARAAHRPRTAVRRAAERHALARGGRIPAFRLDRAHGQRAPPVLPA